MPVQNHFIVDVAEAGAITAIKEYENMSRADPYNIPEYWITCRIASDLAGKGLTVECEKRIDDMVGDKKLGGRVDLAVYTSADVSQRGALQALIEVKGPRTTWSSFPADFVRLDAIAKSLSAPNLLIGLVYATSPMRAVDLNKEQNTMKRWLAGIVEPEKVRISARQHLQCNHKDRTPGVDDLWEIMSIFDLYRS